MHQDKYSNPFRKRHLWLFTLVMLFSSCMQFKYMFVSPGRVKPSDLKEHKVAFSTISDSITTNPTYNYETIGHGAGSWRYYPMGVNKKSKVYGNGYENKKTDALGIIELIDLSIARDPYMSIELDAQYPPEDHLIRQEHPEDGAYIMHDIPKWEKPWMSKGPAWDYLHNNTVRKALDHFTNKAYYNTSKMYIEIKVQKDCTDLALNDSNCIQHSEKLAGELKDYVLNYSRSNSENWLCITSFSPEALASFRNALPDDTKDKFDYVLILGYTGGCPKSWFAQAKGFVPEFDCEISSFVVTTEWLDCIWFSAQGINNFKKLFGKMMLKRRSLHPDWQDIEFSYSTYQHKENKMSELMTRCGKLDIQIRSFMVDIDDATSD